VGLVADQGAEPVRRHRPPEPQAPVLEPGERDAALDREGELVDLERLGHEVVGARADRLDGELHRAERRDQDDRQLGPELEHAAAQLHAADVLHVDVADHDVDLVVLEDRERLRAGAGGERVEAAAAQAGGEQVPHALVIVDDQHPRGHGTSGTWIENVVPRGLVATSIQPR